MNGENIKKKIDEECEININVENKQSNTFGKFVLVTIGGILVYSLGKYITELKMKNQMQSKIIDVYSDIFIKNVKNDEVEDENK